MRAISAKWALILGGVVAISALGGSSIAQDERSPAPPAAATRCLSYPLEDTQVVDRETLFVQDQSGHAALIKMRGPCLEPNEAVGIKYYGSNQICGRLDVDISGSALTGMPQMCMIDAITPVSKEEAATYRYGKSRK